MHTASKENCTSLVRLSFGPIHVGVFELEFVYCRFTPTDTKAYKGGLLHYTDTSEPVDGNGAQNMVTVQTGFRIRDLSITGPMRLPTALTGPSKRVRLVNALSVKKKREKQDLKRDISVTLQTTSMVIVRCLY
jgi:hypothetical protein